MRSLKGENLPSLLVIVSIGDKCVNKMSERQGLNWYTTIRKKSGRRRKEVRRLEGIMSRPAG